MNREQLEEIRRDSARFQTMIDRGGDHPAAISARAVSLALRVPALLDEIDRLTRELDTMRAVAQGNKRHVAYLTAEIERSGPVSLGTECLRCRHVYNWHSNANGWCAVVVDGQQCGCYFVAPTAEGIAEGDLSKSPLGEGS